MTFLPKTLRFTRDEMTSYILAIPQTGFKANPNTGVIWSPKGVVWHNASIPDLKIWASYTEAQKEAWGDNYDFFCKTVQHWHASPHAMGTPEAWSIVLGDLQADGVHDSCRNSNYFGVETVGNFEVGADDPKTGAGLAAMQASANIIAALCIRFGFDPYRDIDFHRNCLRDKHACPGSLVTDAWAISLVENRIKEILIPPSPPVRVTLGDAFPSIPKWPDTGSSFFQNARDIYAQWKSFGVSNPFALGMLAQAEAESSFNPRAVGDKGTAFGLYQWHLPRCYALQSGCGINPRTASMLDQVKAAHWELLNLEEVAYAKLSTCLTAMDAGIVGCVFYERAGAAGAPTRRGIMAERWAKYFS